jgi:hypothetical protein
VRRERESGSQHIFDRLAGGKLTKYFTRRRDFEGNFPHRCHDFNNFHFKVGERRGQDGLHCGSKQKEFRGVY